MRVLILMSAMLLLCINQHSGLPTTNNVQEDSTLQDKFLNELHRRTKRDSESSEHHKSVLEILTEFIVDSQGASTSISECLACELVILIFQTGIKLGANEDNVGKFITETCTIFGIETYRVCSGIAKLYTHELYETIGKSDLSPIEICRFLIQGCGNPTDPRLKWTVPLTAFPKPPVEQSLPSEDCEPEVYNVLQISDVHVDPFYAEGSNANCGEPLCCRETSGKPDKPEDAAGYWGDYRNCDIPLRTLENMLDHISKTHQIDYVLWTGDIPPHDTWNNSRTEAVSLLYEVSQVISKYLGAVPIFPALGNHESSPVNSFPIPQVQGNDSISWLYGEVVRAWGDWVPGNTRTLYSGAYYTSYAKEGLRIISLNTNYCNTGNWWLLLNSNDPTEQLAWLVEQLQMAENNNEKVHIIGHIPSGYPDCAGVWSSQYYKIINRYESTVTAQFFGHTHTDEFEIFYDEDGPDPNRATSISYISPSVTTYETVNPGYRIYTVDANSKVVLDHQTYIANLTEGNDNLSLEWKFEYSAREAYNMTSLSPSEWDRLTQRFEDDDPLFQKFYSFYYKKEESRHSSCGAVCKTKFICQLRRGRSNYRFVC